MNLPEKIKTLIGDRTYTLDEIGMSDSQVLLFEDMVLKIRPEDAEAQTELEMMRWMRSRLPVPEILCHAVEDGRSFLLMSRISGKMTCDLSLINDPEQLIDVLCEGLKMLWNADISDCPVDASLDHHLTAAEHNVRNGLVDTDDAEPETFGENGFKAPEELLEWLKMNRPKEDLVLSHGDYCLPNIFADEKGITGFIDLGRAGVADRYRDIAICYRSLTSNLHGSYGGHPPVEFDPNVLFERLNIKPDWDKIRYYILMDELF